tara:strand:+ start:844 stop:999 length:156 start_codon:yes stop_codon:yes gene_type:complete
MKKYIKLPEDFLKTQKLSALENEGIKGGTTHPHENIKCKNKKCPHRDREQQ